MRFRMLSLGPRELQVVFRYGATTVVSRQLNAVALPATRVSIHASALYQTLANTGTVGNDAALWAGCPQTGGRQP